MAAYAALVSLTRIVEQIHHHPFPPITLNQEQMQPLLTKLAFLQHFLQNYPHIDEPDRLNNRIADVACAAQETILSRIQSIHGASTSSVDLHQDLQQVLQDLQSIVTEVIEIQKSYADSSRSTRADHDHDRDHDHVVPPSSLLVGLQDGAAFEIRDKLTGELPSSLLIIPIVGMGGIGKTTLAETVYQSPIIVHHFDIRAWISISVEHVNMRDFFLQILACLNCSGNREGLSDHELGMEVYRSLWCRRYLVVIDDMWSFDAWENVSSFFPDNGNRSKIIVTTRLSNVASMFSNSYVHEMKFLDEDQSWDLFCKHAFRYEECYELESIGKIIARECGGLPLSIVVVGGLLAKSPKDEGYWKFIAKNLSSAVNLTDNERCLKILYMSYNQLPVYLKPCFLYFAISPKNNLIRVSRLVMLWVAEGFLRPVSGKSLEIVAEDYLQDLVDRNLIIVRRFASDGKIKFCKIHDLLRDLCLRQAEKEDFFRVARRYSFGIHQSTTEWNYYDTMSYYRPIVAIMSPRNPSSSSSASDIRANLVMSWLLKFLSKTVRRKGKDSNALGNISQHVNLRYLAMYGSEAQPFSRYPSSLYLLWNLQTLIVNSADLTAPVEIWKMPQLRHIIFSVFVLPNPPQGDTNFSFVLGNLQTLSEVKGFKLSEEVVRRIPNLKKLKVAYYSKLGEDENIYCINNISCLMQLESLSCFCAFDDNRDYLVQNLTFPLGLRKLSLEGSFLRWEDMTTLIGPLPRLQVLKLRLCAFTGAEWKTVEDQFCSLMYLVIDNCLDLETWTTESSHFPCLEHIVLRDLENFREIPLDVGNIPTLRLIELDRCKDSAVLSAKSILKEQIELDNEDLQIRVKLWKNDEEMLSLASPNFLIRV